MSALVGRRAVVTGGTKGGAAVVAHLRSLGAHVTAVARSDGDGLADDFVAADVGTADGIRRVASPLSPKTTGPTNST
jgi:NAD(P)-dependent dehydrogenase (short-subunit alcohol dehydrogenase family)